MIKKILIYTLIALIPLLSVLLVWLLTIGGFNLLDVYHSEGFIGTTIIYLVVVLIGECIHILTQ